MDDYFIKGFEKVAISMKTLKSAWKRAQTLGWGGTVDGRRLRVKEMALKKKQADRLHRKIMEREWGLKL